MMIQKRSFAVLSLLASAPLMAAPLVTANDVAGAKVYTITISTMNGHVNIANGHNCLAADNQEQPSLVPCSRGGQAVAETKTVRVIELKQGLCLADGGQGAILKKCNNMDPSQEWSAIDRGPTEVKNMYSAGCLTAGGLNKAVRVEKCNGSYTQSWKLP